MANTWDSVYNNEKESTLMVEYIVVFNDIEVLIETRCTKIMGYDLRSTYIQ